METLEIGEMACWQLNRGDPFDVELAPGAYAAWAKGLIIQIPPPAPELGSGGTARLKFESRKLDSMTIDLGTVSDLATWRVKAAFSLQTVFAIERQMHLRYQPWNTVRFEAETYGPAEIHDTTLMVLRVAKASYGGRFQRLAPWSSWFPG